MMLPGVSARISARAATCATLNTPDRLTSTTASQSWSLTSTLGVRSTVPALLTTMVGRPRWLLVWAKASVTLAESVTSAW